MKIKRSQLFRIQEVIQGLGKSNTFKFGYACAKNLRLVKREIEDMQKALEPDEQVGEFEKERILLCQKFSKKEGENPIITGNRFEIDETKMDEFNAEIRELRGKYKETLMLNDQKMEAYNKALREEIDINFHLVKLEDVPPEMKPDELEVILDWIIPSETQLPS